MLTLCCCPALQLDNLLLQHPANGGPPQLKLCDFGLSKDEAEGAANSSCGTPEYMAPEVCFKPCVLVSSDCCTHPRDASFLTCCMLFVCNRF